LLVQRIERIGYGLQRSQELARHGLQLFGRLPYLRDVVHRACQRQLAGLVAVRNAMQAHMAFRTVWPDDTVFELDRAWPLPAFPDRVAHHAPVVRMNQGQEGLDPAVKAARANPHDAAGLGGPDKLFGGRVEFPGTDVTDSLDLGQLPFEQLLAVPRAGLFTAC
jgi:hypothetical protein